MSATERFDVVVVGSGAGGGVVAGELAERDRRVLLLECGPHRTAADFTRWEAKANHDFWWPIRFAPINGGADGMMTLLAARCVGGTTTVNTKVALRADEHDLAKWHEASGLVGESGLPFGPSDLAPHYDRVEAASRRPGAHRLAQERPYGRARLPRPRRRAPPGALVHRRELHELRLVPAGLPDERRQVDAQHVHPRRLGGRAPRAPRGGAASSGS